MIFTPPSSPKRPHANDAGAIGETMLIPDVLPFDKGKAASALPVIYGIHDLSKSSAHCSCQSNIMDCQDHHQEAASIASLVADEAGGHDENAIRNRPFPVLNKYGDIPNIEGQKKAARRRANQVLRSTDPERYCREMVEKKAIRDAKLRAEKEAAHQEPTKKQSLQDVATTYSQELLTYAKEPLSGLNKYGDVPNPDRQRKAARRRRNQILRKEDPIRYEREMTDKKAIRDAQLRAERDDRR